jgi:pimeloyl-ACP methyl ester carboxylesterase
VRAPRRSRITAALLGLALIVGSGYSAYVGATGSDAFVNPRQRDLCGTPATQYGWEYEAINYDQADDARLMATSADQVHCPDQGTGAGSDVVTADGVPIAGLYIPAAAGTGPTGPTVVLVHGWNANKSEVLRYAVPLHEQFNIVAFDLRGSGRSGEAPITFGVQERLDVRAVIDWLERTKHPSAIGLMGNSMGGAAALAEAVDDPRVRGLVLDSTHASVVELIGTELSTVHRHPRYPGAWAMTAGIWLRTGHNPASVDPADTVRRLGDRPLLLIHGSRDIVDVPRNSAERTLAAAKAAGVEAELRMCDGSHGTLIDECAAEWASWAVEFFSRTLGR